MELKNKKEVADALKYLSARLSNKSVSMAAGRIICEEIRKYDPKYPVQVCEKKPRTKSEEILESFDDPAIGECSKCERHTWTEKEIGKLCNMIQPDRTRCKGKFVYR